MDRFYNRFLRQTPAQMWNRLKSAKRNRDESAEENKKMRTVLNASMVSSIEEAGTLLFYKNVHLPVEEDDEFAETM
ncbi:hypothetical protein PHMEG_00026731 [Phytophthora megakarya]|uniref:Uncharacterized protein n=1 Tax=Phytophthora megakarya TaxID=4795 RepID=A0A225V7R2_9STRA|nr:hypothetical protein PHMEG_00026731 [Phytophthora megakarya]